MIIKIIYNFLIIPVLYCGLKTVSLFTQKIRRSVRARRNIISRLEKNRLKINPYSVTVLFHCSSMGEYKQIVPVAEKLASGKNGEFNLVLSLYSPSAYDNITRSETCFSIITYTPFDFYFETRKFINIINPDIVLISKHDVWPNFIWELKRRSVPVFLINGLFADDTKMNRWYTRPFFRSFYSGLAGIFAINEKHRQRFLKIYPYPDRIEAAGDTRYDSAIVESESNKPLHPFSQLEGAERVFVAGSSWPAGEKQIIRAWKKIKIKFPDAFLIIVPHEIGADHIYKIESLCQESGFRTIVLTEMKEKERIPDHDVLIVDKIGLLSRIYAYASLAYVGGGFSKNGLHSVIEPAVYGLPVFFGPNLDKSPEAQEMNLINCGIIFNNHEELFTAVNNLWSNGELYSKLSEISRNYIKDKSGATEKIIKVIIEKTTKPKLEKRNSVTEEEFERMLNEENNRI